ncbi:MAG: hypothetical protein F6K30_06810 [Cyanothece sp. SIO2G6]|nr:hypothetical protein [Cyanothece sp. SIO2G6]
MEFVAMRLKFMIPVILILFGLIGGTFSMPYPANAIDWTGKWCNELGSSMSITSSAADKVIGTYVNRAPGYCAQPTESFPLIGSTNDEFITFAVNWGRCQSLTSWVGNYNDVTEEIIAPWKLIYNSYSGVETMEGSDTFHKCP